MTRLSDDGRPRAGMALAAYTGAAVILTWPLALHLTDRLPAGSNDLFQNYWNFWWWKTALLDHGESPYHTDLLFFPDGASLAFHTHSEANIFLGLPLLALLGPAAALNIATLAGFVLSGWGMHLLAFDITRSAGAAFVAGLVFAYFPQHCEQSLEHLNLASYGAMPLVLLFIRRAVRTGRPRSWWAAAAAFALNALFSWHNGLLVVPAAAAVFVFDARRTIGSRWRAVRGAGGAALLAGVLLAPFLWPMLSAASRGEGSIAKPEVHKPVDLAFLAVPHQDHPIWGRAVAPLYARYRSYPSAGFTAYVGAATLALAACALWPRRAARRLQDAALPERGPDRAEKLLWAALAAGYGVLALGSELRVLGEDCGLPLPFALLRQVPLFGTVRVANRFLVPAMLALALLAACGAARLTAGRRPRLVAVLLALLVVADYLWIPYPLRTIPRPDWIDALARAPSGALLNLPGGYRARAAEDMAFQTHHGRPIVGGYVSVTPPAAGRLLARHPALEVLFEGRPAVDVSLREGLGAILDDLSGVTVVAVHLTRTREALAARQAALVGHREAGFYSPEKGIPAAKLDEARRAMRALWGAPFYADGEVELYRRPAARKP